MPNIVMKKPKVTYVPPVSVVKTCALLMSYLVLPLLVPIAQGVAVGLDHLELLHVMLLVIHDGGCCSVLMKKGQGNLLWP